MWASNVKLYIDSIGKIYCFILFLQNIREFESFTFLAVFPPTQGNQEECRNQRAAFPVATKYSHLAIGKELGHRF